MVAVRGFTTVGEQLAGGTVQGIFGANPWAYDRRDSWNEITAYAIQDVTVDGAKLTAVARSATGDDDGALLRGLLKGNDHLELGDSRDVILAHGGRDRIRGAAPTVICTAGMATT